MLNLLKQLVAIPSVHGHEELLANFVYDFAKKYCQNVTKTDDYVVAKLKGKTQARPVILCGHLDTVDPGAAESWHQDPNTSFVKEGKLYGLGAADMKAGVAVMLQILKHYGNKRMPETDLWFVFVNNEEVDGRGSEAFMREYGLKLAKDDVTAYILEPTPDNGFLYGCKGSLFVELTITGAAGHASAPPHVSEQALHKAAVLLADIKNLESAWQEKFKDEFLGVPTITATSILGASGSPNKLSESCRLVLDIRTTPQIDKSVKKLIEAWADSQGVGLTYLANHCPAALSSLRTETAKYLVENVGLKPNVSLASSDQVFFTQAGITAYLLGPGDMAQAHQPNEFVHITQLKKYFDLYIAILGQR